MTARDDLRKAVARAIDSAELGYSIRLTRLVDGDATYELCIEGDEVIAFSSNEDAREYLAQQVSAHKAQAALSAARPFIAAECAKVAEDEAAAWQNKNEISGTARQVAQRIATAIRETIR